MDIASEVAGLISLGLELTTVTYNYIHDVRDAPEEARQFHNELTALLKVLKNLQLFLKTQDTRQTPFTSTSALVTSTSVCEDDFVYLKSMLVKLKNTYEEKRWPRRLAWPFQKDEHTRVLRRIKDYTQTFHFSVTLEGCELLAKTGEEVDKIHKQKLDSSRDLSEILNILGRLNDSAQDWVEDQRRQSDGNQKSYDDDKRKDLLKWLSEADPSTNHNNATKRKEPGTGEWFLSSDGFTGCGKTVLCSSIIECVQDLCRTVDKCKSAYFYFDFQKTAEQNIEVMLRSLLRQLCSNEPQVPPAVQELHNRCKESGYNPSKKDLEDVFIETIGTLGKEVYILLDALDELPENGKKRAEVLQHITTIVRRGLRNLHVLATSRDELDIRKSLESSSNGGTPIETSEVDSDIGKYVRSCLQEWPYEFTGQIKDLIETRLSTKAKGMFRWAFCQIETLEGCSTTDEIEEALDDLPTTLDETYEKILRDIWKMDAKKAKNILTWLLFSEWPLTLEEVADAAVVKPGDNPLSPGSRLLGPTQVLRICRSLITVSDEYSRYWDPPALHGRVATVRFAHFSVKEYLVSGRSNLFTGMPITSHQHIAECCVSMLLPIDRLPIDHEMQLEDKEIVDLLNQNHTPRGHGFSISGGWKIMTSYHQGCRPVCLVDATHHFIKAGSEINDCVPELGTALNMASKRGNYRIVEILLTHGADADLYPTGAETALIEAVRKEHESIVRLLLKHGSNANLGGGATPNALEIAVHRGNEAILRLLLEYGADANGVLFTAIISNHEATVRLLLEYGADADNGLHLAAKYGREAMVRLLLEYGANANYADALQDAAGGGNVQIAEMLVQIGAKVNAEICTDALYAAAKGRHFEIFEWLLERGASIRAAEGDRLNIFLAAVGGGNLNIVSRLVELGVDIDASGCVENRYNQPKYIYTTALQYASYSKEHGIVEYLLNNGAQVNKPEATFGTTIQAAIRGISTNTARWHWAEGHIRILRLLLKHGADIDQQVNPKSFDIPFHESFQKQGNALQQAAAQGQAKIAQLLVKSGADINAQNKHRGTALMCASRQGNRRTLKVLVSEVADVNAQVAGIGSALSEAARWGQCKNVQFLVDNGADANAYVGGIGTALSTALQYRQINAAVVLIEAGGDLHAAFEVIGTAFSLASEDESQEIVKFCLAVSAW